MYEYKLLAKYYDLFYENKSYAKEVSFLTSLIGNRKTVLDVGCGTGRHIELLVKHGYLASGLDLNEEMLEIAKTRTNGEIFASNLLDFKLYKKYDAIISMFAVFNHLQNYEELEQGILNCYNHLNSNGILIIDLYNARTDGSKEDYYKNYKRVMSWKFNSQDFTEHTDIDYYIDNEVYHDTHHFKIYEVAKLKELLEKNNLDYVLYENYTKDLASDNSKNIEIIIKKGI